MIFQSQSWIYILRMLKISISKKIPKKTCAQSGASSIFAALCRYEGEKKIFHCSIWKSQARYFIWEDRFYCFSLDLLKSNAFDSQLNYSPKLNYKVSEYPFKQNETLMRCFKALLLVNTFAYFPTISRNILYLFPALQILRK